MTWRDQGRKQRLPLAALPVLGDVGRERLVREQERLREVEQRRPQLVLDARAARRVLDVLGRQRLAQLLGERVRAEDGLEHPGRTLATSLGDRAERAHELGVDR